MDPIIVQFILIPAAIIILHAMVKIATLKKPWPDVIKVSFDIAYIAITNVISQVIFFEPNKFRSGNVSNTLCGLYMLSLPVFMLLYIFERKINETEISWKIVLYISAQDIVAITYLLFTYLVIRRL